MVSLRGVTQILSPLRMLYLLLCGIKETTRHTHSPILKETLTCGATLWTWHLRILTASSLSGLFWTGFQRRLLLQTTEYCCRLSSAGEVILRATALPRTYRRNSGGDSCRPHAAAEFRPGETARTPGVCVLSAYLVRHLSILISRTNLHFAD